MINKSTKSKVVKIIISVMALTILVGHGEGHGDGSSVPQSVNAAQIQEGHGEGQKNRPHVPPEAVMAEEPVVELAEDDFRKGFDTLFGEGTEEPSPCPLGTGEPSPCPSKWDSSEKFTKIKNQGNYGTCWAHATLALMESSLIQQGYVENEPDLSERHLAYFGYTTGYDRLGNASGDTIEPSSGMKNNAKTYFDVGGNYWLSANRLINWQGAAAEADYPYGGFEIDREYAQDAVAALRNCYFIPTSTVVNGSSEEDKEELRSNLKTLIKEFGGIMWSYKHDAAYLNNIYEGEKIVSSSYYSAGKLSSTNHAITIVGWDDDYPKENFKSGYQPSKNGAWLVRNSWGEGWGTDGYFYMSFEEPTLGCLNGASVYVADDISKYDNNYFYDNVVCNSLPSISKVKKSAAIYQINNDMEKLQAVSFILGSAETDYSIRLYKLDNENQLPDEGKPLLDAPVTGKTGYAGVYTADINEDVYLFKGDRVGVVVEYTVNAAKIYYSANGLKKNVTINDECDENQMFLSTDGKNWKDCYSINSIPFSFNLNLLTKNEDMEKYCTKAEIETQKPDGMAGQLKNILSWNKIEGAKEYSIYRKVAAESGEYIKLATVNELSYTDELDSTKWKNKYSYIVKAVFKNFETSSEEVVSEPYSVKAVINNIEYDDDRVCISWEQIKGAGGYIIERSKENADNFEKIATISDLKYEDDMSETIPDKYYYRIKAYNDSLESEYSDVKSAFSGNLSFEITFIDKNGNTIKKETVRYGMDATPPESGEAPVGYEFAGWNGNYKNVKCAAKIYVKYSPIVYKIEYVLNGGFLINNHPTEYTIESENVYLGVAEHEELFFDGWYDNEALEGEKISYIAKGTIGDKIYYAKWREDKTIRVDDIVPQKYTGYPINPDKYVRVYYGKKKLQQGIDYTVVYKNNTNASEKATALITYKGDYSGSKEMVFKILPKSLEDNDIYAMNMGAVYSKKQHKPLPSVKWGDKTLSKDKDYELIYNGSFVEPGEYGITIKGKGNYAGQRDVKYTIVAKDKSARLISKAKITNKIPDIQYTGEIFEPKASMVIVKSGKTTLIPDVDYTLNYTQEYRDAGTYKIELVGMGDYVGSKQLSFKIKGISASTLKVRNTEYNGNEITPEITDKKGILLKEGTDYTVENIANNVNAGTAKIKIKGKGQYTGTVNKSFRITSYDLKGNDIELSFANNSKEQAYNKGGAQPKIIVRYKGEELKEKTDYTVKYLNNKKKDQTATVKITGKKNYKGTISDTFVVTMSDISALDIYCVDRKYSKTAGKYISKPVITDKNGKRLALGTDYEKEIVYEADGVLLDKKSAPPVGTVVTVTVKGKGMYFGETKTSYKIVE